MLLPRTRRLPESAAIRRIVVGALVYSLLAFVWAVSVSFSAAPAEASSDVGQTCSTMRPGTAAATFSWPRAAGAYQVWLDLSLFDNGFLPGSLSAARPPYPPPHSPHPAG